MPKIGRNQICPCGSGRKYKHCHGGQNVAEEAALPFVEVPEQVLEAIRGKEVERQRFARQYGAGRGIISMNVGGTRFVAAGKTLHYSSQWRSFHDFLNGYLAEKFGREWGERQVKLPFQQQHPAVQWHTQIAMDHQNLKRGADDLYILTTGAGNAWLRLAYDLYLIDHNAELQKRLIKEALHNSPSGLAE